MARQGSFKRAVRQRARESGQRYTQARAAMDKRELAVPVDRLLKEMVATRYAALKAHLEARYGIRITSLAAVDDHHPATLRVKRKDGQQWIARISSDAGFSSPATEVSRVEDDAEILRFLTSHDFPSERVAHHDPVSVTGGRGVLVTEFVAGGRPKETPAVQHELAGLLGRLHTLPAADGAIARDGGSFDHDARYVGRPRADLAAAMSFLVAVEDRVAPQGREKFEWLRDQVESADDGEGLPEALTHGNYFGAFNAVGKPGNLVVVAWAASGRGPRLHALAWQLSSTLGDAAQIEAIVRGYREHVRLTDEELERLASVRKVRALYMACWYYRASVQTGYMPSGGEGWWPRTGVADAIAERAVAAFRGSAKVTKMPTKNAPTSATRAAKKAAKEPAAKKKPTGKRVVSEEYGKSSRPTVLKRYRRNADAFEALIAATPPDRWEQPSPCEDWLARDVVGHVVELTRKQLRDRGVKPTTAPSVRKDPLAAFRAVRSDLERVLADPTTTAEAVNWLDAALSFDLPQHWWDLAKATGQDATMDPEFVQTAWDTLAPMTAAWWDWQRKTIGAYGPAVAVPQGAPLQDRLLGLLGRNPNWSS